VVGPAGFNKYPLPASSDGYNLALYRKGTGSITGIVQDGSGNVIHNADVYYHQYSSTYPNLSVKTDVNGVFTFPTVIESWPPTNSLGEDTRSPIALDNTVNDVKKHKINARASKNVQGDNLWAETWDDEIIVPMGQTYDAGVIVIEFPGGAT